MHYPLSLALLLFCFVDCTVLRAQELREANPDLLPTILEEQLEDSQRRVEWLQRAVDLREELDDLERQIEQAEEKDDEDGIERLEEQLAEVEQRLEEALSILDLFTQSEELRRLSTELRQEELDELAEETSRLFELQKRRFEATRRLCRVYRQGPESDEGELEEELEALAEDFDRGREIVELKFDLHWARDEGDEEAIEELTEELKELRAVERVLERPETKPESDDAANRFEKVRPIEVDASEVAAAAKLPLDGVVDLLKSSCFECHGSASASGGLDLERLVGERPLVRNRSKWLNVRQQIALRSMPPSDAEQPSEDDRRRVVAYLTHAIDEFDYESVRSPGWEPARRLTHAEYDNTIRDLFGVDLRPSRRFPVDMTASSGFENSANSLFVQPILMERYIDAAESVVTRALPIPPGTNEQRAVWDRLLGGRPPREAVGPFARRAFRRPLDDEEASRWTGLYDRLVEAGATDHEAFREVVRAALISPSFLVRTERDRSNEAGDPFPVSDHELASRLSYFLWNSMPDEELLRVARAGTLNEPEELNRQVARMLRNDRAGTLGTSFASQWLGLNNLDRLQRDQIDNPWATDSLLAAVRDETALFFHSLVVADAPIERLLDADYTFLNGELARHYRIPGVAGEEMRRVELEGVRERGGLLGQASVLAVTSFPGRTSPVVRGNWILTNLLGTPPPPPPPNVSEFDEEVAENERLTQRQKLELHRRNPNCYVCHSRIDPLGFALEGYDWFGRRKRGRRVDEVGELPGGRTVDGLPGLRSALVEERLDDLTEQLTRKMLAYALGRQLDYYDEATVRGITAELKGPNRRFQTLIRLVVASDAFRRKQRVGE